MKMAGQLIKKYGFEFLCWLQPPNGYKVTSLVWFLTKIGQTYLSDQLVEYSKQNVNLSAPANNTPSADTKVGEDIEVKLKPKTLKEFLQYGKN